MSIESIPIDLLHARSDALSIDDDAVHDIALSMQRVGQIALVIVRVTGYVDVRPIYQIVSGRHRVEAARLLGHESVLCHIRELDDVSAELIMLDENLARRDLTLAQRAKCRARQKVLYLEQYPDTEAGVAGGKARQGTAATDILSFAAAMAKRTGVHKRTVQRDVERGEAIRPEILDLVTGTCLDCGEELDALAKLPPDEQEKRARLAASEAEKPSTEEANGKKSKGLGEGKKSNIGTSEKKEKPLADASEVPSEEPEWGAEDESPAAQRFYDNSRDIVQEQSATPKPDFASVGTDSWTTSPIGERMFNYAIEKGIAYLEEQRDRVNQDLRPAFEACLEAARNGDFEEEPMRKAFENAGRQMMKGAIPEFQKRLQRPRGELENAAG